MSSSRPPDVLPGLSDTTTFVDPLVREKKVIDDVLKPKLEKALDLFMLFQLWAEL